MDDHQIHFKARSLIVIPKNGPFQNPANFYIWFLVDLIIMILMAVSAIVLITQVSAVCKFFKDRDYVIYILFSVGAMLLFLCIFVTSIHSKYIPVRIILGIVVTLWSISFATEFESIQIGFALISLGVTTTLHKIIEYSALWQQFSLDYSYSLQCSFVLVYENG
ncbi:unnamed protein product [Trichobilharzia szidati]|nr:unnamed protein product [Trichobilharzia szidati]